MRAIRRKYFIAMALVWPICFVLFVVTYIFVLVPQSNRGKEVEKKLIEKKQTYKSVLEIAQENTKVQLSEEIKRLQAGLGKFVVNFEDSADLTFDISRVANEYKVDSFSISSVGEFDSLGKSGNSYILENSMDVSFSSSFNHFAGFLNALERYQPIVFIDTFKIGRSRDSGANHRVDIKLLVLVRKPQDS